MALDATDDHLTRGGISDGLFYDAGRVRVDADLLDSARKASGIP